MQTTMRYLLTLVRMATVQKKNYKIANIENDVEKLKPFCTVSGSVKWYNHLENNMEVS